MIYIYFNTSAFIIKKKFKVTTTSQGDNIFEGRAARIFYWSFQERLKVL